MVKWLGQLRFLLLVVCTSHYGCGFYRPQTLQDQFLLRLLWPTLRVGGRANQEVSPLIFRCTTREAVIGAKEDTIMKCET